MPEKAIDLKIALSATQQRILGKNPARRYAIFVKDAGTDVIRLAFGIPAVSGRGLRLNEAGSNYEINLTNLWTGEVYAIAESGTPDLIVQEW
ncbi:unnamed protein product [marine sediment metagenome]|uniref:Uncharacterized protein n=1 Tax=marine sediment metagenome TaxID=412755 RepID=X1NRW7_9ZZZZ